MRAVQSYVRGIGQVFHKWKMWLILYVGNILLALLVALPFSSYLKTTVRNNAVFDQLIEGFDFTILNDFMLHYGEGLQPILNQSIGLIILYLILTIFWTGGILSIYKSPGYSFQSFVFWRGCTMWFWRLLRMSLYFWLIQAAVAFLFVFLGRTILGPFDSWENAEVDLINLLWILVPVYLATAIFVAMIHDYAKIIVVRHGGLLITRSFWRSLGFVFRRFWSVWLIYLLNLLGLAVIVLGYNFLSQQFDVATLKGITLAFIVGQAFVFAQIGTKMANLASASIFYDRIQRDLQNA